MLPPPHDVTQPWHVADAIRQRAPLTAAELVEHPAFKTVNWDLPPTKKGSVAVAHGRGGPLDISYEIHGHGPIHLVVSALSLQGVPVNLNLCLARGDGSYLQLQPCTSCFQN